MNARRFEIENDNLTVDIINELIDVTQGNARQIRTFSLKAITSDGRAYEYATIEGTSCYDCRRRRYYRLADGHLTIYWPFGQQSVDLDDIERLEFALIPGETAPRSEQARRVQLSFV